MTKFIAMAATLYWTFLLILLIDALTYKTNVDIICKSLLYGNSMHCPQLKNSSGYIFVALNILVPS